MELMHYREYRSPPMVLVLMATPTNYLLSLCPSNAYVRWAYYPIPTVITVRGTHLTKSYVFSISGTSVSNTNSSQTTRDRQR